MLARIVITAVILAATPVAGSPRLAINARATGELARDAAHVRALRAAVAKTLSEIPAAHAGYTLDVSLVELELTPAGADLEVRAVVRALLSDSHGRIQVTSTARAIARGLARDRALLQRDAIGSAGEQLANRVRTYLQRARH